jgi:hypothetical protein
MAECACESGRLALARGRDAGAFRARAREIGARLGVGPESRLGREIAELEREMGITDLTNRHESREIRDDS